MINSNEKKNIKYNKFKEKQRLLKYILNIKRLVILQEEIFKNGKTNTFTSML
jgi:hypothetical protein